MSRMFLGLAAAVLAVTCVVAMVRAQDATISDNQGKGAVPGAEPIPAATLNSPYVPFASTTTTSEDEPSLARPPAQETESGDSAFEVRRPTAAERLKQIRDSADTSGRTSTAKKAGASLSDPVSESPSEASSSHRGIDARGPAIITPSEDAEPAETTGNSRSGGLPSVLKKTPGNSISDRSTARRVFRSPGRANENQGSPTPTTRGISSAIQTARSSATETLTVSQGPGIRVETIGHGAISIGKEAEFTLVVHNDSDIAVSDVLLRASLPATAKVVAEGSSTENVSAGEGDRQRLGWTIPRIGPREEERLTLRVTPTENRPLDLLVDWTIRPVSAVTQIEVRQPLLELSVYGRRDMLYGETGVYTIRLANPGTGDAEDVSLQFGYGDSRLEPKPIGVLGAGQQTEVTVELTAKQAGEIFVKATATGSGGLTAEASQEVFVRRAKLEVDVTGDPVKFAGATAPFRIVVRNTGDAPAADVVANITLPKAATLKRASDGTKPDSGVVAWNIGALPPNGERSLELQCLLTNPGDNQLSVRATGSMDVDSSASFVTRVEALADLKLAVVDPSGPVEIGKDALYEIRIANHGTKAATSVNVMAQFSRGIEPLEATGAQAEIVPGQVLFKAIPRIEAGQEITLTIKARADSEGNKLFRAEVACEESNTQLVAQEATYFFNEATRRVGSQGTTAR